MAPAGIAAPPAITPSPPDISYQKLFGTWALDPSGFQLGFDINSSALSSKWAVVGAGSAADRGRANEGAVQVYNAATGAWMRKLLPPGAPAADQRFGDAVALSGDTLLVGADAGGVGKGAVYVYNLATGALLRTLTATGSAVGDYVGFSVAVSGNVAAVGAYGDSAQKGAVYLFNLTTGAQTAKIVAAAGVGGDVFGYSLAVEGNILAIGAPFDSGDRGAVYFHDLSTQVFIKKYQPSSSVVADHVGSTVAMHQGRVVVGTLASVGDPAKKVFITDVVVPLDQQLAPPASVGPSFGFNVAISGPLIAVGDRSNGHGRVHLYSAFDGSFIRTILPPNGDQVAQRFGVSLALTGNTLLVGASNDRTQTTNVNGQSGAAYLIGPFTQPMAFTKVAATGDYAPDGVELNYGTFGDVFTNNVNTAFTSQLTGLGSNKGKDMGVSSDLVNSGRMQLDLASREPIGGGVSLGSFSRLAMNSDQLLMTFATLTGTGINATNNQAVLGAADSSLYLLLQTGKPVAPLGGGLLLNLPEMAASNDIPRVAFICNLRQGPASGAVPKVDASNDSGLLNYYFSTDADAVREGSQASPSLDTTRLGQLAPRLALASIRHFYSAALTPPASGPDTLTITPTNNTALFRRLTASEADVVAVKGDSVKDAGENIVPAIHYAAFIGEASGGDDHLVYRATMASTTPGAVTTATNEALWAFTKNNDNRMVLRKGQSLAPFLPGLTVAGIINYWATAYQDGTEQAIALVKLGGPGVTAANDQALLLWQTTGTLLLLMREGDAAPGCPGAKIGVITRVEVDNVYGNYAILATLTGATPTSDLALFTGIDNLYNNAAEQAPLRRPVLRLRKGQLFDNQPGHVRSISLPTTNLTASGAGGTGRGHALSSFSNLAIVVEFDNGVRQVMKGRAN